MGKNNGLNLRCKKHELEGNWNNLPRRVFFEFDIVVESPGRISICKRSLGFCNLRAFHQYWSHGHAHVVRAGSSAARSTRGSSTPRTLPAPCNTYGQREPVTRIWIWNCHAARSAPGVTGRWPRVVLRALALAPPPTRVLSARTGQDHHNCFYFHYPDTTSNCFHGNA